MVIRDERGHFVAGVSRKIISNGPACLAEARRLGHVDSVLEGDSTELIRALCTNKNNLAPRGNFGGC